MCSYKTQVSKIPHTSQEKTTQTNQPQYWSCQWSRLMNQGLPPLTLVQDRNQVWHWSKVLDDSTQSSPCVLALSQALSSPFSVPPPLPLRPLVTPLSVAVPSTHPCDLKSQQYYPQQPQPKANGRPLVQPKNIFWDPGMRYALGHEDFRKLTSISSSCKLTWISQYSWESSQKPCTHVIEKHKTQCHPPRAVCHLNFPSAAALPCSHRPITAPGLYLLWLHAPHTSILFSVRLNQRHPGGPQHQEAGEGAAGSSAFFHVERCVLKDTIETFIFLSTTYLGGKKKSFSPLSAIKLHHKPSVLYLCRMSQCVRDLYLVIYVSTVPSVPHYLHYYDFIC